VKAAGNELSTSQDRQSAARLVDARIFHLNDARAVLLIAIFSAALVIPIALWGIPQGGDLANHYRFALPFYESIEKGNLYPGWLAESNDGYGDARFRFYPPGLYYLLALLKPVTGWFGSSVVSFAILSALGCLGVYFWTRSFLPSGAAALASVLYGVTPYHLNELYQASLLSEYAGCAVLPFVFAFADRVCMRRKLSDVAALGAVYALLILTNLPLAVIGSLSVLVFSLARIERDKVAQTTLKLGLGVFIGLAASAFFWVRILSELSWIKGSGVDPKAYYDYRLNFIFSPAALTNRNTWYANLLALTTLAFLLPAVILVRKAYRSGKLPYLAIFVVTVFSFMMTLPLSKPLWSVIPKLSEVQFPWRWLAVTSLTASVLVATALPAWFDLLRTQIRPLYFLPMLGFVFSIIFVATQIVWDSDYMSRQEFASFLPSIRGAVSFKDWLPVNAQPLTELPKMSANVELDSRRAAVEVWEPEFRKFQISDGPAGDARVKTFYYPNWIASAGTTPLEVRPSAEGVALLTVPSGATTVEMRFREPPKVKIASVVSGISWLLLFFFAAFRTFMKREDRAAI